MRWRGRTCCLYQLMVLRCSTKSGGDSGLVTVQGSWRRCSCGGRGAAPLRCVSPHLPVARPAQHFEPPHLEQLRWCDVT